MVEIKAHKNEMSLQVLLVNGRVLTLGTPNSKSDALATWGSDPRTQPSYSTIHTHRADVLQS
jgi:hypothetical protein